MRTPLLIDGCNPSNWDDPKVYTHLAAGGVTAVNATTAVWEGYTESLDGLARWRRRFREHAADILPVTTVDDIDEAARSGRVGIILGWQNLSPLENDFERLEVFAALGVRIAQLAYNIRNLVANGCYERVDDGLSSYGLRTVAKLNELGVLIDLSHVGDRSAWEAVEHSDAPVAITHANRRAFHDTPRNKPDDLIRAVVEAGGVIGANAFPRFLPRGFDSTIEDFLDAIENMLELVGVDHVGIATDLCEGQDMDYWHWLRSPHGRVPGAEPQVPRPDPALAGLDDAEHLPRVRDGLLARGHHAEDVDKILGGNWRRLYGQVWR